MLGQQVQWLVVGPVQAALSWVASAASWQPEPAGPRLVLASRVPPLAVRPDAAQRLDQRLRLAR